MLSYSEKMRCFQLCILFFHPPTHLPVYPSSNHLSAHLSIYLLIYPNTSHPATQPPIRPSSNHSSNMYVSAKPYTRSHVGRCSLVPITTWIWLFECQWLIILLIYILQKYILFYVPTGHQASAFHNSQTFPVFLFYSSLRSLVLLAIGIVQLSLQSTERRNKKWLHRQNIYLARSVGPASSVIAFKSG